MYVRVFVCVCVTVCVYCFILLIRVDNISPLVPIAGKQTGFNGDNGDVDEMEEFTRLYKEWKGLDDNFTNVPSLFTKVTLTPRSFSNH